MRKVFIVGIMFFEVLFFIHCHSIQVIPEPNLEQVTVKSETICTETPWYSPFCTKGKSRSLLIKGVYNNLSGEKKYFLNYYLDILDTDLPVGISLNIDGTYYNLKKISTDYADILSIESELNQEVITKVSSMKGDMLISYSNRKNTLNFALSQGDTQKFITQLNEVTKRVTAQEKLKIVK